MTNIIDKNWENEEYGNVSRNCSSCMKYTSVKTGAKYYPALGNWHSDEPADLEDSLICPKCQ